MNTKKDRGLDYTSLFRFLLSKAGSDWDKVLSEAKSRLDKTEPIFWVVVLNPEEKRDYIWVDHSTYFSRMRIDEKCTLQLINSQLRASDMQPSCTCFTHTLNGKVFRTE